MNNFKRFLKNRMGIFDALGKEVMAIVTVIVTLAVGFLVVAQTKTNIGTTAGIDANNATQCAGNLACNSTNIATNALATIPGWLGLLILLIVVGFVIFVVRRFGGNR